MKIPFFRPSISSSDEEGVLQVLRSGHLTSGPVTCAFEDAFRQFICSKHAVVVNSCTAALHLACRVCGIGPGDRVFVPSLTFVATAEAILHVGATPIFIDVELDTRMISINTISKALDVFPDVRYVVGVHFAGQSLQIEDEHGKEGLHSFCRRRDLRLIEDAAHAFPSRRNGKWVGETSEIACFSFYGNKAITTGEGGLISTNNYNIAKEAKLLRSHGISPRTNKSSWDIDVVDRGHKYNLPEMSSALGLSQLKRANSFRDERQRCAELYFEGLRSEENLNLPFPQVQMDEHSWHIFPVRLVPGNATERARLLEYLPAKGIGTSVHYTPLHKMSLFKNFTARAELTNTECIATSSISLPIYPDLDNSSINYIVQMLLAYFCQ